MAATDGQIIMAAARWSDEEADYLREFAARHTLPAVVKVVKGQYGGLGVPSLPSPGLQATALLVSAGRRKKIMAQSVKVKEGRSVAAVGPRLAIPDSYPGYFELLSEEGRSVRCMESVSELARRRPESGCLVREPIRVLAARLVEDGSVLAESARHLPAGETLLPAGETHIGGSRLRYLRCLDGKGDSVLLAMDQRGRFSALAREDNISGVHTAKNLLCKRMPLTVRLVHGTPPRGLKSSAHFVPELRLLSTFEEEHIFALPLQKESSGLISLPLASPLKLQRAKNEEQLGNFMEYGRLVEKCNRLMSDAADRVHVLDGKLGDPKRWSTSTTHNGNSSTPIVRTGYFLRKSTSMNSANHLPKCVNHSHHHQYQQLRDDNGTRSIPQFMHYTSVQSDEYDEIDQIYDYVRGFAPLPKNIKSPFAGDVSPPCTQHTDSTPTSPVRPEPPPVETIPSKKLVANIACGPPKAEKRTRRGLNAMTTAMVGETSKMKTTQAMQASVPKLYIKHAGTQRGALQLNAQQNSKAGSPLFNIRYKSLTDLQQTMELDTLGTLDSSHSGGRTSGDSGAGAKLPEKRSRRLSRPRSLTNLVWELRGCSQEQPILGRTKFSINSQRRSGTLYL